MKIKCQHGFFIFEETKNGQVSDFMARFGFSIVPYGQNYTFDFLSSAPRYSLKNKPLLNVVATKNFEGEPSEVFEANGLVYDFSKDLLVPIISITQIVKIDQAGNKFLSSGLILPGSVTADGERVKDYSAWFSRDTLRFLYSEVTYV